MTKLLALLSATAVAGAGALWLARTSPDVRADAATAVQRMLAAPGRIEPIHDAVDLAFEAQGRIAEILVDEGQTVRAGQALARLDDRLARARVAAAEASLAQVQARLAFLRSGPRRDDIAVARAEADAATVAAQHRGVEQQRSAMLGKAGALAAAAVDADNAAARIAAAQAQAASARFRSLASGSRKEQIAEASATVAQAQAELDAARVVLDQTYLRAPVDGVVLRRTAEPGALITLTTPITVLSLADVRRLELRVEVDEADINAVRVGQVAYATADAYGDRRFPVRITRVTHQLGRKTVRDDDPRARFDTRVLEVIAQLEDSQAVALPLGLRMVLHIEPAMPMT